MGEPSSGDTRRADVFRDRSSDRKSAAERLKIADQLLHSLFLSGPPDAAMITTSRSRMRDYLLMAIDEGRDLERKAMKSKASESIERKEKLTLLFRLVFITFSAIIVVFAIGEQMDNRGMDPISAVIRGILLGLTPSLLIVALIGAWSWASRNDSGGTNA
jgi:hypothetical protein